MKRTKSRSKPRTKSRPTLAERIDVIERAFAPVVQEIVYREALDLLLRMYRTQSGEVQLELESKRARGELFGWNTEKRRDVDQVGRFLAREGMLQ